MLHRWFKGLVHVCSGVLVAVCLSVCLSFSFFLSFQLLKVQLVLTWSAFAFRSKRPKPIEEGVWDCSVCTYRNSAEAFKCDMCDVRKGTSTRWVLPDTVSERYIPLFQKRLAFSTESCLNRGTEMCQLLQTCHSLSILAGGVGFACDTLGNDGSRAVTYHSRLSGPQLEVLWFVSQGYLFVFCVKCHPKDIHIVWFLVQPLVSHTAGATQEILHFHLLLVLAALFLGLDLLHMVCLTSWLLKQLVLLNSHPEMK